MVLMLGNCPCVASDGGGGLQRVGQTADKFGPEIRTLGEAISLL